MKRTKQILPISAVRWLKFNLVGTIGIGVQLGMLYLLTSLGVDYMLATALAVESAVLHNFLWHERFTWPDRISQRMPQVSRFSKSGIPSLQPAAVSNYSQRLSHPKIAPFAILGWGFVDFVTRPKRLRESAARLLRFNLTTGAVSIGGNLLLMRLLVGQAHLPPFLANLLSIAGCSLVNFLVSDRWVFRAPLWPVASRDLTR